ncbi:MAG TPA: PKD domain-containing protein, partial [Acidimicrobiia bacterium]|nr:PKD domain-containing protein [Acidimicrobiia bacterium]
MGRIDGRLLRRGALILLFLGGGLLFAACATPPGQPGRGPVASFDASPTSGNSPLPVTFTDHSTGTITGWQWAFGDTTTSTTQSPTHTYDAGGTYTVALTVNGAGGSNTTSKTITVNARPVVSISAPPDGTTSAPELPVTFTGSATDPEDGDLATGIQWSSSIDGALGSGASLTTSGLSSGTHTITAAVTDSAGATGTATITVVVNAPPRIGITSPETGATYSPGDAIPFTGSATDLEDGVVSSSIQWSSSKDGALGTGGSITSSLTSGAHTITASVTDSGGKMATTSVSITVNALPDVAITGPQSGAL